MALGPLGTSGSSSSSDKCYEPLSSKPRMSRALVRVAGGKYEVSHEDKKEDEGQGAASGVGGGFNQGGGSGDDPTPPSSPTCFELRRGVMMRWPQPMLSKPPGGRNPPDDGSGDNVAPPDDGAGGKADDSPEPPDGDVQCSDKVWDWLAGCTGGDSGDKHHENRDNQGGASS